MENVKGGKMAKSRTIKELIEMCRNRGDKISILAVWNRSGAWKNIVSITIDGRSYKGIGYSDIDMAIKDAMNRIRNGEEN